MGLTKRSSLGLVGAVLVLCFSMLLLAACSNASTPPVSVNQAVWVVTEERVSKEKDSKEEIDCIFKYSRDASGNVVSETEEYENGVTRISSEYDQNGWLTRERYVNDLGRTDIKNYTNTYDEAGRLLTQKTDDVYIENAYDENGNLVKETCKQPRGDDEQDESITTRFYSATGLTERCIFEKGDVRYLQEYAYDYNDDGRPTSCVVTLFPVDEQGNKTGEGELESTAQYAYDENGNVSRFVFEQGGETMVTYYQYTRIDKPSLAAWVYARLFLH